MLKAHQGSYPNTKLQEDLGTDRQNVSADSFCGYAQRKKQPQQYWSALALKDRFFQRDQHPAGPTLIHAVFIAEH